MHSGSPGRVVIGVLLAQAAAFYAVAARQEVIPDVAPLSSFPREAPGWRVAREYDVEKEVQDVLRADDTLSRVYVDDRGEATASLFMAFFKTQRYGQSPHSPKNCLPGAGWTPSGDRKILLPVPGRAEPIQVNDYVVQRGNDQSVVLYWYQTHARAIAGEITARFWLVADAIRYRRSDTALVRVIVPVRGGDVETAEKTAFAFTQSVYPQVVRQLPQ